MYKPEIPPEVSSVEARALFREIAQEQADDRDVAEMKATEVLLAVLRGVGLGKVAEDFYDII